jgi:nucleoside-diphosphate-sugar epimerase
MGNYLVTGAAGFIASRVSELLLEDGHTVVGVDNLNDAYDVRLKEWRLARLKQREGFTFAAHDICDMPALEKIAQAHGAFDAVINLAARAGVRYSVINPWAYLESNTTGALNLLELCRRYDIPKFVLASTSSIYGANPPLPTPEDADSSHPLQPYAASKKGAETMAYSYHYLFDIDVTVFRYFTVYGPAGRPDMVMFRFAKWIAEGEEVHLNGDGTQTRGFTYLDDIARGTILGLKPLGYEIINLGGHQNISINDLIAILEQLIGQKARIVRHDQHPADAMANQAVVEKARRMLGWDPQVSLEVGIPRMVDWYMQNREWARDIELS